MILNVVLMVIFGCIESGQRLNLRHDRLIEPLGLVELLNIGLGSLPLLSIGEKNCRTILATQVKPLLIELGRIMGGCKEDLEQLLIGNLRRIIGDFNRLRMAGFAGAHLRVMGRFGAAA